MKSSWCQNPARTYCRAISPGPRAAPGTTPPDGTLLSAPAAGATHRMGSVQERAPILFGSTWRSSYCHLPLSPRLSSVSGFLFPSRTFDFPSSFYLEPITWLHQLNQAQHRTQSLSAVPWDKEMKQVPQQTGALRKASSARLGDAESHKGQGSPRSHRQWVEIKAPISVLSPELSFGAIPEQIC